MVETKINVTNFKAFQAPGRKLGLREDQISIGKYGINIPAAVATKLGDAVALLYSDTDKALAIQKSATGGFKLRQIGKIKSTKSVYCKGLIEAKKIKKGRYTTQWDEKAQMLIAKTG
jgi:hypothetical protein